MNTSSSDYSDQITQVIAPIILGICCKPEECEIIERVGVGSLDIEILPHMSDYAVLCGKKGRTIRAFKFIVEKAGLIAHQGASIELQTTFKGEHEKAPGFRHYTHFQVDPALDKISELWNLVCEWPCVLESEMGDLELIVRLTPPPLASGSESLIVAIGDVMYPYGYRQGLKINVKVGHADNRVGTSAILGNRE